MRFTQQNLQFTQNQKALKSLQYRQQNNSSPFTQQFPPPSDIQMTEFQINQFSQMSQPATPQLAQSRMISSRMGVNQSPLQQSQSPLQAQFINSDQSTSRNAAYSPQQNIQQNQYHPPVNTQLLQYDLMKTPWQPQTTLSNTQSTYNQMKYQDNNVPQNFDNLSNEDKTNKLLLAGPIAGRSMTDIWALVFFVLNFLCFLSIGIVGFATCKPFDLIDQYNKAGSTRVSITFNISDFFNGMPAVAAAFGTTFIIGLLLQIILMRFTYCILMSLLCLCLILFIAIAIMGFITKQIFFGVVFVIIFLIYLFYAYKLYQKLPALDKVAKLSYKFTVEMAGQFCLTLTFLFIFIIWFVFYLFSILFLASKYTVVNQTIDIDPTYKSLLYTMTFNFFFLCNTTMQFYKFCISYMCAQWFFGRANQVTVVECIKLGFNHLGSFSFQTILIILLHYVIEIIKSIERSFQNIGLICISSLIQRCRKPLEKLISSLTLIRIALTGNNFCESSRDILKQILHDPFYFLFVIWGADTVSGILSFFTFLSGFIVGIYILILLKLSSWALVFGIILVYVITIQTKDLFVQNFQMVLYSIGAFYNMCEILFEKDSTIVKNQLFFSMRDDLQAASSLTNLNVKDIS
ncbi:plasma-membrane choline transporter (macronuclear) [Tetrahymena thermophila SB210]|uniref:Choline transporter-like protein n=1 Tax=Tetrahymena thermophila (strain SB210) TaxID=312017 RepID=I7LVV3_TETTS|nr:plasma-membrane choline transporter [Tetrahymena thermophila SB210]EAR99886.2 plasma-membrane choline transporter [Tetrahymena thermophila SB210]|eukprot:XP_001020131.2 plasma-membrane choline transporter [Tetrahymena thermophila SB210]